MASTPKAVADDTRAIIDGWAELAPAATFAGMTLAQFKTAVQPSFDARALVAKLETNLKAAQDARDAADVKTSAAKDKVVKAVVADANYGDDSALYESMGYVRKSARASGLTRKANALKAAKGAAATK